MRPCYRRLGAVAQVVHAADVRIFISSLRRGLEVERDSLPGLIRAVGHEPTRFEDFAAQAEPSREACLLGVDSSDAYLLLLGPHYGHRFPETGQSPTHDEWVAATTKGLPRLVFRKAGVAFESEQEEFARQVGDYSSGVFYAAFTDVADLLTRVADALRPPLRGTVTPHLRNPCQRLRGSSGSPTGTRSDEIDRLPAVTTSSCTSVRWSSTRSRPG